MKNMILALALVTSLAGLAMAVTPVINTNSITVTMTVGDNTNNNAAKMVGEVNVLDSNTAANKTACTNNEVATAITNANNTDQATEIETTANVTNGTNMTMVVETTANVTNGACPDIVATNAGRPWVHLRQTVRKG